MKKILSYIAIVLFIMTALPLGAQSLFNSDIPELTAESVFQVNSEGRGIIYVTYNIPVDYHQIENRDFFYFTLADEAWVLEELVYPPSISYGSFNGWEGEVTLQGSLRYNGSGNPSAAASLPVEVHFQLCDEKGTCLRPEKAFIQSSAQEGLLNILPSEQGMATNKIGLFLLFAFLGGIILNIMPCVLPVLSLKALHLVQQSGDDKRKILFNSFAYAAGVIFSMLVLGGVVMAIKASGTLLGWGFQFQNPTFVLVLTSLVLLFSLSLFEVFFINPPQAAGQIAQKQSHGYLGSFVTGIMAVLLATPCTAPLLGSALGFAFAQPGPVILVFFTLIGLGLALPFIILGLFPAVVNRLPKPGEWMNRFREIMGFLLMGTVVYLLTILHGQVGTNFRGIMWFLLILTFATWLYGRAQRGRGKIRYLLMAAALAVTIGGLAAFVDLDSKGASTVSKGPEDSVLFSPEDVERYRNEGTPLFLEFSADWCATCRSNHVSVLDRDFRRDLFKEKGIVYMVGDYTLNDPVIGEWLRKYERAGVPLYVYFPPGEESRVLPEVLTRSILEKYLGVK